MSTTTTEHKPLAAAVAVAYEVEKQRERTKAFGEVMNSVADMCRTISFLSLAAIEQGDTEQGASMSEAAMVLAGLAGALADRASRATGECGIMNDDEWLYSPRTQAALRLLEGAEPATAAG